jgi:hypothetical protein
VLFSDRGSGSQLGIDLHQVPGEIVDDSRYPSSRRFAALALNGRRFIRMRTGMTLNEEVKSRC